MGFSATAPSLSNTTVYPTFSRVVPSDVSQGQLLAELVAALGWRYVSVLSSTDVYSQELSSVFRASCRDLGIIVRTEQSFSATSTVRELGNDMEDLKAANTNVRLLIAGSEEIAKVALQAAYEAGLFGPNEVWLGVDGGCTGCAGCGGGAPPPSSRSRSRTDPPPGPTRRLVFEGPPGPGGGQHGHPEDARRGLGAHALRQQGRPVLRGLCGAVESDLAGARAGGGRAGLPRVRTRVPQRHPALGGGWGWIHAAPTRPTPETDAHARHQGAYAYDATMLVAEAWAKVLKDGGDPRDLVAGDLLRAIRTVQYVGVTGNVTLNANGNPATAKYTVHQVSAPRCSSSSLNGPRDCAARLTWHLISSPRHTPVSTRTEGSEGRCSSAPSRTTGWRWWGPPT